MWEIVLYCPYGGIEYRIGPLDVKNATVGQILDALVSQHGNGAWVGPGLVDDLQTTHRICLAGPTTFAALLTSLQMGFRTLAIQKSRPAQQPSGEGDTGCAWGRGGGVRSGIEKDLLGGLGAIAGAFAGYHMRKKLSRGMPDLGVAVLEDAFAIGGGVLIIALTAASS